MGTEKWVCREPDSCFACPYSDCIKPAYYIHDPERKQKYSQRGPKKIPFPEGYKPPEPVTYVVELEDGSIRKYHRVEDIFLDVQDSCGVCFHSFAQYCCTGQAIKGIRSITKSAGWTLAGGRKRVAIKATWEDGRSIIIPGIKETTRVLDVSWGMANYYLASGKPIGGVLLERVEP